MPKQIDLISYTNIPTDLVRLEQLSTTKKIDFVIRKIQIGTIEFALIDIKLPAWTQEDIMYKDDEIRALIPRGLCYIFANNVWIYTLYGHPKFGDIGDYLSKGTTMEDINRTTTKVFRRKENGECAHWGAFVLADTVYEVYGSKNVHMVVRSELWKEDLELYVDQRYTFAQKMARLINTYNKTATINYLVASKNTLCGEGCFTDSQHFVKYASSTMFFFAVTGKRESTNDSIVKISPLEIDQFISSLGLTPVLETIIVNKTNQKNIEEYFELMDNSEGAVISCVDNMGFTVYMYKHKNYDYVYQRALREQMKQSASIAKISDRFERMHIHHPNHDVLLEKFLKFNAWFRQGGLTNIEKETFFENWVNMVERFNLLTLEEQCEYEKQQIQSEQKNGFLNVIMLMAIPGSGKSFVAKTLTHILKTNGKSSVHLEQDMFKGSNPAYQKAIAKSIEDPKIDYIILAKANHSKQVRDATYNTLNKCSRIVNKIFVQLGVYSDDNSTNNIDMAATANLCVQRIKIRGFAHTTLFGKTDSEIRSLLTNVFIGGWQDLTEEESKNPIIKLEINQSKQNVIKSFCTQAVNLKMDVFVTTDADLFNIFQKIAIDDEKMVKKNKK